MFREIHQTVQRIAPLGNGHISEWKKKWFCLDNYYYYYCGSIRTANTDACSSTFSSQLQVNFLIIWKHSLICSHFLSAEQDFHQFVCVIPRSIGELLKIVEKDVLPMMVHTHTQS